MDNADEPNGRTSIQAAREDPGQWQGSEPLFVVRVSERRCERLANSAGGDYVSPPQPLQAARELVALLGCGHGLDVPDSGEVVVPVPGGSRKIALEAWR